MPDLKRTQLSVRSERALLAGAFFPGSGDSHDESLEELESLAHTARAKVVAKVSQRRMGADATYFFGRGKAEELAEMCVSLDIDVIRKPFRQSTRCTQPGEEDLRRCINHIFQLIFLLFLT